MRNKVAKRIRKESSEIKPEIMYAKKKLRTVKYGRNRSGEGTGSMDGDIISLTLIWLEIPTQQPTVEYRYPRNGRPGKGCHKKSLEISAGKTKGRAGWIHHAADQNRTEVTILLEMDCPLDLIAFFRSKPHPGCHR